MLSIELLRNRASWTGGRCNPRGAMVKKKHSPQIRWNGKLETLPPLSIRQPFAWLIVNGFKDIENRSWRTRHRGDILIHGGVSRANLNDGFLNKLSRRYHIHFPAISNFDTGGVVGIAFVADCRMRTGSPWHLRGNVGWVLTNPRRLKFRACKGALNLFRPNFATKR
jgi:hypothetical protein